MYITAHQAFEMYYFCSIGLQSHLAEDHLKYVVDGIGMKALRQNLDVSE
jgi:hypothetical protein